MDKAKGKRNGRAGVGLMKSKAYDEKTIAEIREKRRNGVKVMQLAIEYFVHYRTIENYCKGIKVKKAS